MSAFIVTLGLLLTFFAVLETAGMIMGQNYEESHLTFVTILISCVVLLLINDACVVKNKWAVIALWGVISASAVMLLSLIAAVIVQFCNSRFKARWDSDGLILLSSVILGMTGCHCMI